MKTFIATLFIFLTTLIGPLCAEAQAQKLSKEEYLQQLSESMRQLKAALPLDLAGQQFIMTDVSVSGTTMTYTLEISEAIEKMLNDDASMTDQDLSEIVLSLGEESVADFVEYGVSLRYIFLSINDKHKVLDVKLSPDRLKSVLEKTKSGEIQTNETSSFIESIKMEFVKMNFPVQVGDGVWLTEAYVEGNCLCYVQSFDSDIYKSAITEESVGQLRQMAVSSIKNMPVIALHKDSFLKEDIHIKFICKDKSGNEFLIFTIAPEELFPANN